MNEKLVFGLMKIAMSSCDEAEKEMNSETLQFEACKCLISIVFKGYIPVNTRDCGFLKRFFIEIGKIKKMRF